MDSRGIQQVSGPLIGTFRHIELPEKPAVAAFLADSLELRVPPLENFVAGAVKSCGVGVKSTQSGEKPVMTAFFDGRIGRKVPIRQRPKSPVDRGV